MRHSEEHIRSYKRLILMGSFTAKWITRGRGSSTFNFTMTIHGFIYHYTGELSPPLNMRLPFLSMYIHDTYYVSRPESRSEVMPLPQDDIFKEHVGMIHAFDPYF